MNRFARKIDNNQAEIVQKLRQIPGVTVHILKGDTIDLVIGRHGTNYLVEIKDGLRPLTESQKKFLQTWRGQISICRSLEDVLAIIGAY